MGNYRMLVAAPETYVLSVVRSFAFQEIPGLLDCNEVTMGGTFLAFYFNSKNEAPAEKTIKDFMAAHNFVTEADPEAAAQEAARMRIEQLKDALPTGTTTGKIVEDLVTLVLGSLTASTK